MANCSGMSEGYRSDVEFRLLGPVEVELAGSPVTGLRRHERLLLAALLLEPGRVVPAGRLIRLLWDTSPPARARAVLHTYVSRLRRALAGPGESSGLRCTASPAV
jgi:DNA-binding SARP family transcriptional activator